MCKINVKNCISVREKIHIMIKTLFTNIKKTYAQDVAAMASSILTDMFPKVGKYITDIFVAIIYNKITLHMLRKIDINALAEVGNPNKILIISDLNIGDAVNLQSVVLAVKRFFSQSKIDYAVNKNVNDIIAFNPYINKTYNILSYDTESSAKVVKSLITSQRYDFVINLCPFFKKNSIVNDKCTPYLSFASMSAHIIHNELYTNGLNHISYQAYNYFSKLLHNAKKIVNIKTEDGFTPSMWISNNAVNKARVFLNDNNLLKNKGLVLFNPDATSKYTQMPFDIQVDILNNLCKSDNIKTILLTSGHTFSGIENKLIESVSQCDKIIVIPKYMSLDVYSALIDFCDVFITSDTGTMHIAAARKFDEYGQVLKNKTAVFSMFGATSARLYGYSSFEKTFLNTAQDAPAKMYISNPPCRNITCTNKKAKRCSHIRCFRGINSLEILNDIVDYISRK